MVKTTHHKKTSHTKPKVVENTDLLNPKKVGVALGYTAVVYVLLLSICTTITKRGIALVSLLGSLYLGYEISFFGVIIGMAWAFIDFFIGGFIFALIYNKVQKCKWDCKLLK